MNKTYAQKFVIGNSPMTTAEVNEGKMDKLRKRSYHLLFFNIDSLADTSLLKLISGINTTKTSFCILLKKDTNKIALYVEKLKPGYKLITFWESRAKKLESYYDSHFKLTGQCTMFFNNGAIETTGKYLNGKQNGKWVTYGPRGKISTIEYFDHGQFVPNQRLKPVR